MLSIKSLDEIVIMKEAGKILSLIRKELLKFLKVGISTFDLDMIAFDLMKKMVLFLLLKLSRLRWLYLYFSE